MNNKYSEIWDKLHKEFASKSVVKYDDWLVEFDDIISNTHLPIIDLGCGSSANNTLYLLEKGKRVISCDFSKEALDIVSNIKGAEVKQFDMLDPFPFEDNCSDIIIADLSLHYFRKEDTLRILKEIKRVLRNKGHLFFRVNSTNSTEYKQIIKNNVPKIEDGLFFANNMEKRFFSKSDIDKYFVGWSLIELKEENMTRWSSDKIVWMCVATINK